MEIIVNLAKEDAEKDAEEDGSLILLDEHLEYTKEQLIQINFGLILNYIYNATSTDTLAVPKQGWQALVLLHWVKMQGENAPANLKPLKKYETEVRIRYLEMELEKKAEDILTNGVGDSQEYTRELGAFSKEVVCLKLSSAVLHSQPDDANKHLEDMEEKINNMKNTLLKRDISQLDDNTPPNGTASDPLEGCWNIDEKEAADAEATKKLLKILSFAGSTPKVNKKAKIN